MNEFTIYAGLFAAAFVAATFLPFLPGSSELALAGLLAAKHGDPLTLVAVATSGNVLGALVNFAVGRYVSGLAGKPWFPLNEAQIERGSIWFGRYGIWVLLMSWLPVAGDLITLVAGLLRTDIRLFLILTSIGRFARYVAIAAGVGWFQP